MSASPSRTLDRSKSGSGVKGNKKEGTGFLDHQRIRNTITDHKMISKLGFWSNKKIAGAWGQGTI
jgi:hypothetical protein